VSLNNVTVAEAKLAAASKRKKTAAEAALTEAKANAERDLAIATSQVSLATDLSNEQSREAVLLNSQGLSIDHAVMAAKAGATAERYKEIIA
jgi:hypothetical protein